MRLKGPKKLVKRAAFAARLLGVLDAKIKIKWAKESTTEKYEDSPNEYKIRISRDTPKELLIDVIAHEMMHVHQYERGDLRDVCGFVIWQNVAYEHETCDDDYWLAPWELEARAYMEWVGHKWETRKRELH